MNPDETENENADLGLALTKDKSPGSPSGSKVGMQKKLACNAVKNKKSSPNFFQESNKTELIDTEINFISQGLDEIVNGHKHMSDAHRKLFKKKYVGATTIPKLVSILIAEKLNLEDICKRNRNNLQEENVNLQYYSCTIMEELVSKVYDRYIDIQKRNIAVMIEALKESNNTSNYERRALIECSENLGKAQIAWDMDMNESETTPSEIFVRSLENLAHTIIYPNVRRYQEIKHAREANQEKVVVIPRLTV